MIDSVFCIAAAIVGAGFASGREIMQFYSQYGFFSWILIAFSVGMMTALIYALTDQRKGMENHQPLLIRILWILLYSAVCSSMTAAAGEMAALTIPVHRARMLGMAVTLAFCVKMSNGNLLVLSLLGKLLVPGIAIIFLLCMRVKGIGSQPASFSGASLFQAAGYCSMNAVLTGAVTAEAGKNKTSRERLAIAVCAGMIFGGLLALGNASLLPHGPELREAALPMVLLLKAYGKTGFYLSASALYLAITTTLIAALRGMKAMLPGKRTDAWAVLIVAGGALLGFREIVSRIYPILGYLCLFSLVFPKYLKKRKQNRVLHRSVYEWRKGEERG